MGDQIGVHSEKNVKALKPQDRAKLRAHVVRELLNSKEIRAMIAKDPTILTQDSGDPENFEGEDDAQAQPAEEAVRLAASGTSADSRSHPVHGIRNDRPRIVSSGEMNMHIIMAVLSLALLIWAEPASAQTASAQTTITASVSRHRGVAALTAQEVRTILANASQALQTNPGFACAVTFKLKGPIGRFGSKKRPAVIKTEAQKNAVHQVDSHRTDVDFHIKVVKEIEFCTGPGIFRGCAWRPDERHSIIVVRQHAAPHILWAHEYGHLTGRSHRDQASEDPNALMTGCGVKATSVLVTEEECNCLRGGPGACGLPTPRQHCPSP